MLNDKTLNECIELSKKYYIYDKCMTAGKFNIDKFKDDINWHVISWHQRLSEEFIREFKNKIDWYNISRHQILSEEFIIEFKDKFYWYLISRHQILSEEFIRENLFDINIDRLLENTKINSTKEFIDKIKVLKMLIE